MQRTKKKKKFPKAAACALCTGGENLPACQRLEKPSHSIQGTGGIGSKGSKLGRGKSGRRYRGLCSTLKEKGKNVAIARGHQRRSEKICTTKK